MEIIVELCIFNLLGKTSSQNLQIIIKSFLVITGKVAHQNTFCIGKSTCLYCQIYPQMHVFPFQQFNFKMLGFFPVAIRVYLINALHLVMCNIFSRTYFFCSLLSITYFLFGIQSLASHNIPPPQKKHRKHCICNLKNLFTGNDECLHEIADLYNLFCKIMYIVLVIYILVTILGQ